MNDYKITLSSLFINAAGGLKEFLAFHYKEVIIPKPGDFIFAVLASLSMSLFSLFNFRSGK